MIAREEPHESTCTHTHIHTCTYTPVQSLSPQMLHTSKRKTNCTPSMQSLTRGKCSCDYTASTPLFAIHCHPLSSSSTCEYYERPPTGLWTYYPSLLSHIKCSFCRTSIPSVFCALPQSQTMTPNSVVCFDPTNCGNPFKTNKTNCKTRAFIG